jgi:hypothetical protein
MAVPPAYNDRRNSSAFYSNHFLFTAIFLSYKECPKYFYKEISY